MLETPDGDAAVGEGGGRPPATSHSRIRPSSPAVARAAPSGENAAVNTKAVCPLSSAVRSTAGQSCSATVRSTEAVAANRPCGWKATASTQWAWHRTGGSSFNVSASRIRSRPLSRASSR
jgi:hypothetical protein